MLLLIFLYHVRQNTTYALLPGQQSQIKLIIVYCIIVCINLIMYI